MKYSVMVLLILLMAASACSTEDKFTGKYTKEDGEVNVQMLPDKKLKFFINTVVGMHTCTVGEDGEAVAVIEKRFLFVDSNNASFKTPENCTISISFEKNSLKVITNGCGGYYCGMHAVGSMDGIYVKKSSIPDFPD